ETGSTPQRRRPPAPPPEGECHPTIAPHAPTPPAIPRVLPRARPPGTPLSSDPSFRLEDLAEIHGRLFPDPPRARYPTRQRAFQKQKREAGKHQPARDLLSVTFAFEHAEQIGYRRRLEKIDAPLHRGKVFRSPRLEPALVRIRKHGDGKPPIPD